MQSIPFRQLPLTVRLASFATGFMAWIMLAEFVIDRHSLDRFLPFYRVDNLCPYEALVLLLLAIAWMRLHRRQEC